MISNPKLPNVRRHGSHRKHRDDYLAADRQDKIKTITVAVIVALILVAGIKLIVSGFTH